MTYYPQIGSVSEGTMRAEDLIDTLASELSYHMKRMRLTRDQRKRFNETLRDARHMSGDQEGHPGNEQCQADIVEELFEALNEIAPPYCTFGASEGDGASYGFWPFIDDELPRLVAGDDIPREHCISIRSPRLPVNSTSETDMRAIQIVQQPATASVVLVEGRKHTILFQNTRELCESYLCGYLCGSIDRNEPITVGRPVVCLGSIE